MPKRHDAADALFGTTDRHLENPAAAPVRQRRMTQRNARRLITATIVLAVLASFIGVVNVFSALSAARQSASAAGEVGDMNSTPGKPLAVSTMRAWVSADPPPFPGAQIISWDGADLTPPPTPEPGAPESDLARLPNYTTELHRFTLIDSAGTLYAGTITIQSNPDLGSRVTGTPSATRMPPSSPSGAEWGSSEPWQGWSTTQTPSEVDEAVREWASAFTSGDPRELRRVVGDTDATRSYMPLGAAQPGSTTTAIRYAALRTPEPDAPQDTTLMLVRVELSANFGEPPTEEERLRQQRRPAFTYDLLVSDADTATPRVVSWGPVGTGPDLSPYSVAITGRELVPAETPAPTGPAPGSTPGPSATPDPAPATDPTPAPTGGA